MAGDSSNRSNLIAITWQELHTLTAGQLENTTIEQLAEFLELRIQRLRNISEPFGLPSDASRKQVESGTVTLNDNVALVSDQRVGEAALAVSKEFNIDEVEALLLVRSWLFNEGFSGKEKEEMQAAEVVEAIQSFYYAERLHKLRIIHALFQACSGRNQLIGGLAGEMLPTIIHDVPKFVDEIITVYIRRSQAPIPENLRSDVKKASLWAKHNSQEQLILLEVLFWTMWDFHPCDGPMVVKIYEAAYSTNLGANQMNATLLLDDGASQTQQDIAAMWIMITLEVLELERVADPHDMQLSLDTEDTRIYWLSPECLQKIHNVVTSHTDSQFACTYVAWAFFLSRFVAVCGTLPEIPPTYREFYDTIVPPLDRSYAKSKGPAHVLMADAAMQPEVGLLPLLLTLLTNSPLFVPLCAWRTASAVTDPNPVAFRSVFKGLLIAIVELVPVEHMPDFEGLVEVWIALFGRSDSDSVSAITRQYWQADWLHGFARRAIFDVARSRFPVQSKPLIRLLRAMTASGFLDTDPLASTRQKSEGPLINNDQGVCAQHVFYYLEKLSTFTHIIPLSACSGPNTQYEKLPERMISASVSTGLTYTNLRPIKLPGGSTLPAKSIGRLLNTDGGDFVVVAWHHEHSGWKVLLEILTDYVNRRKVAGSGGYHHELSFGRRAQLSQGHALSLEDIGVDMDPSGDDLLVTDALDLIRCVIQDHQELAEQLMEALESGEPVVSHSMLETEPPDLVQLTTMILEDALSRYIPQQRAPPCSQLITSAINVLAALLILPQYCNRVWLYVRSTSSLFGSERSVGFTSAVLAAERLTGQYTMTTALLKFVHQLFNEASTSVLSVLQDKPRLQPMKEEVLMRATRFIHSEIWVEHTGWKYSRLGDRFDIGRRVAGYYVDILKHSPPSVDNAPFANLSQAVIDVFITHATTSCLNPLISSLIAAHSILASLNAMDRFDDTRRLIFMLETNLLLLRILLLAKSKLFPSKTCLLEHSLCSRISGGLYPSTSAKVDAVDALTLLARSRGAGRSVPIGSMEVLLALSISLSLVQDSSPSIVGHITEPEAMVSHMVKMLLHPSEDMLMRKTLWSFITLAVDKEPAMAGLFVRGRFRTTSVKGKEKAAQDTGNSNVTSAFTIATGMVEEWKDLWEANPQLLYCVLRFLRAVWEHGHEHLPTLAPVREDASFFGRLVSIVTEELGPTPDYRTEEFTNADGSQQSTHHIAVCFHAYRMMIKAYALSIIGLDIRISIPTRKGLALTKPVAYTSLQAVFHNEEQIVDLIAEGGLATFDPTLYDEFNGRAQMFVPHLVLDSLRVQEPILERDFGEAYEFSTALLQFRLQPYVSGLAEETSDLQKTLTSINLNMSLAQAQTTLTESWQFVLLQVVPFLRGEATVRPTILSLAANLAADLANENRPGEMMSSVHNARLTLLLSLLEIAWFSTSDKPVEVQHFVSLTKGIRGVVLNEAQPPAKSFLGQLPVPFHRSLLQSAYFCARHSRSLLRRPKTLNADQRLSIFSMLDAVLDLVIDALRVTFASARQRLDIEVDQDMELLVAVFEQCTRPDLNPSTTFWLSKCQESDVIRASLQLFSQMDVAGYSDIDLLRARKMPLYSPHVLSFHRALASIPSAAERLASEGILAAYSENTLSAALRTGSVDVTLPELPGERSPAHVAYCSMLSIVSGIATALGHHGQYFIADACALVQLYNDQLHRALSWTINDSLTLPLLEEIEQSVNLLYAISCSSRVDEAVGRALNFATSEALLLVQQVNYALTHHNHLASVFEPITPEERTRFDADGTYTSSVSASSDIVDLTRRPFLARMVHRLFGLSGSLLLTLVNISKAETVLLGEPEDWPVDQALIVPHSKVVVGEPVSIGTLLELGNHTLDVLRHLIDRPATQTVAIAHAKAEKTPDVRESVAVARRNLEAVAFYTVTQLAMWLSKPEFDGTSHEMDGEESIGELQMSEKERRAARRRSVTLAERLRRGMTGEMAMDLQSLLTKAKPVIAKSDTLLTRKPVDLTAVLSNFLTERVLQPS